MDVASGDDDALTGLTTMIVLRGSFMRSRDMSDNIFLFDDTQGMQRKC